MKRLSLILSLLVMAGCEPMDKPTHTPSGIPIRQSPSGLPIMKSEYGRRLQLEYVFKKYYAEQRQRDMQRRREAAGIKTQQERNKIELTIGMEYGEALDKWGTPDGFTSYQTADEFTIVIEYGLPKDTTLTFRDYELFSIQKH